MCRIFLFWKTVIYFETAPYNFKNLRTEKNEPINPTTAPSSASRAPNCHTNGYGDINVIKLDDIIDVIVT